MSPSDIPNQVLRFISANIDTVPQLEALLLLWESQGRLWQLQEVAARIYVTLEVAAAILQHLQRRQLVAAEGTPPSYRYNDAWAGNGKLMAQVAATYRSHLIPVATFIHSKAPSSVREFARAFDLKKDR